MASNEPLLSDVTWDDVREYQTKKKICSRKKAWVLGIGVIILIGCGIAWGSAQSAPSKIEAVNVVETVSKPKVRRRQVFSICNQLKEWSSQTRLKINATTRRSCGW